MSVLQTLGSVALSSPDLPASFQLAGAGLNHGKKSASKAYNKALRKYRRHVYSFPKIRHNGHFDEGHEVHSKEIGQRTFEYMKFYPSDARELVVLVTGCESKTIHWKPQIDHWLSEGRAVLSINTNVRQMNGDLLDDNYRMFEWLIRDENSPLHQMARELGVPVKVVSHSFGGQVHLANMIAPGVRDGINEIVNSNYLINSFLTAKSLNRERVLNISRELFLNGHAKRHPQELNSNHLFDVMFAHYHKAMGEPAVWASNGPPKHVAVDILQGGGDAVRDDIATFGAPQSLLDAEVYFYNGEHDYMSDRWANENMAIETNSTEIAIKGGYHTLLHEGGDNLELFSLVLDGRADEIPTERLASSSNSRFTRQGITRGLNSATGVLQSVFADRVRNSEMWAEAKRRAVNTSNTLRLK